jgi:hypothetical protein
VTLDQDTAVAELVDPEANIRKKFLLFQKKGGLHRGQVDRLGDEELLGFDPLACQAVFESLVENTLVQRVLIDQHHPFISLDHQVRIVKLNRPDPLDRAGRR